MRWKASKWPSRRWSKITEQEASVRMGWCFLGYNSMGREGRGEEQDTKLYKATDTH